MIMSHVIYYFCIPLEATFYITAVQRPKAEDVILGLTVYEDFPKWEMSMEALFSGSQFYPHFPGVEASLKLTCPKNVSLGQGVMWTLFQSPLFQ